MSESTPAPAVTAAAATTTTTTNQPHGISTPFRIFAAVGSAVAWLGYAMFMVIAGLATQTDYTHTNTVFSFGITAGCTTIVPMFMAHCLLARHTMDTRPRPQRHINLDKAFVSMLGFVCFVSWSAMLAAEQHATPDASTRGVLFVLVCATMVPITVIVGLTCRSHARADTTSALPLRLALVDRCADCAVELSWRVTATWIMLYTGGAGVFAHGSALCVAVVGCIVVLMIQQCAIPIVWTWAVPTPTAGTIRNILRFWKIGHVMVIVDHCTLIHIISVYHTRRRAEDAMGGDAALIKWILPLLVWSVVMCGASLWSLAKLVRTRVVDDSDDDHVRQHQE